ncbi:flagellar hook-associated protein FlgK [Mesobacillus subterraneus]|uniref:flagellar hook-associated protein FlgK n=1 Tax=Mesobacillus subterraneus TaxID=285983 RepID=UPI00203BA560|nr:flagellar hook-associated protein FlgK [Mesobacillus subterraneus]MCM3574117.1 flagellar hook-associated protein FlgK [Mesobacillus subterraneus]
MRSTFMGLETARRGMFTQQSALHTTGHNIANANTPGYSRQRVNFAQTEPYPAASLNRPNIPGQVGTGVKADAVQRIREGFLDVQYRNESNKLGYSSAKAEAYQKLEQIMNEPSDSGLANTMDQFWQALQDLAVNPSNEGARSVVRQRGIAVAETFNYLHNSLVAVQKDIGNEINVTVNKVNSLVKQIHELNKQIGDVEPHGYLPNDLYDVRDRLIDELSSIVNVKVEYSETGGLSHSGAEGKAIIKLVSDTGKQHGILVGNGGFNEVSINKDSDYAIASMKVGNTEIPFNELQSRGKLQGLVEAFAFKNNEGEVSGVYAEMLKELDNLAYTFANAFNDVHKTGFSPNEINGTDGNGPKAEEISFFADAESAAIGDREGFAGRMTMDDQILASLDNIASATGDDITKATLGDSSNVLNLANVITQQLSYDGGSEKADFRNYYEGIIGGMAVQAQEANRLTANGEALKLAVQNKRESISTVSLDEEMTNMIQFQHAYNASARMISLQDELLDKIINGMGTGGR